MSDFGNSKNGLNPARNKKREPKPPANLENLYRRPKPSPFTLAWESGYLDGSARAPQNRSLFHDPNYRDGYWWGIDPVKEEAKLIRRMNSVTSW